jgi:hypothetical protein
MLADRERETGCCEDGLEASKSGEKKCPAPSGGRTVSIMRSVLVRQEEIMCYINVLGYKEM